MPDLNSDLRIAAIQICSRQDRDENLAWARALMNEAVRQGAQLVTLPENFSFPDREGNKLQVSDLLASVTRLRRGRVDIRICRHPSRFTQPTFL